MKGNKSSRNPSHSILTSVLNCKHQKSSLAKISKEGIYEKMLGGSLRCREAEEPGAESGRGSREAARPRPRAHLPPSGKTDWILCRLRFFAWPYGARFVPRHGVGSGLEAVWLLQLNSAKIRAFRSGGHKTPPSAAPSVSAPGGSPTPHTQSVSRSPACAASLSPGTLRPGSNASEATLSLSASPPFFPLPRIPPARPPSTAHPRTAQS